LCFSIEIKERNVNTSEMRSHFEESPVLQARIAGASWWACIVTGLVGFILWTPVIMPNDAAATAANILAKKHRFGSDLFSI
jgi:hypothetical protein